MLIVVIIIVVILIVVILIVVRLIVVRLTIVILIGTSPEHDPVGALAAGFGHELLLEELLELLEELLELPFSAAGDAGGRVTGSSSTVSSTTGTSSTGGLSTRSSSTLQGSPALQAAQVPNTNSWTRGGIASVGWMHMCLFHKNL